MYSNIALAANIWASYVVWAIATYIVWRKIKSINIYLLFPLTLYAFLFGATIHIENRDFVKLLLSIIVVASSTALYIYHLIRSKANLYVAIAIPLPLVIGTIVEVLR
jgi:intracellular septation protein A